MLGQTEQSTFQCFIFLAFLAKKNMFYWERPRYTCAVCRFMVHPMLFSLKPVSEALQLTHVPPNFLTAQLDELRSCGWWAVWCAERDLNHTTINNKLMIDALDLLNPLATMRVDLDNLMLPPVQCRDWFIRPPQFETAICDFSQVGWLLLWRGTHWSPRRRGNPICPMGKSLTNSSPWYRWAIEIDGLAIKNADFPWQTVSHNQMVNEWMMIKMEGIPFPCDDQRVNGDWVKLGLVCWLMLLMP